MADTHSDYNRGEMEISAQRGTFSGFMDFTVYRGALIALALIFAILTVGGVGMTWFSALVSTFAIGVVVGMVLKLNATWYASITILSILTALVCAFVGLFTG